MKTKLLLLCAAFALSVPALAIVIPDPCGCYAEYRANVRLCGPYGTEEYRACVDQAEADYQACQAGCIP